MNKSLQSKNSICAWLFRKGKEACEASFEPDMDLAYEMFDRKIRVQDLLDACVSNATLSTDINNFLNWYKATHFLPVSQAEDAPSP